MGFPFPGPGGNTMQRPGKPRREKTGGKGVCSEPDLDHDLFDCAGACGRAAARGMGILRRDDGELSGAQQDAPGFFRLAVKGASGRPLRVLAGTEELFEKWKQGFFQK